MSTEWKPGDVALRTFDGKVSVSLVAECGQHMDNGAHWHHSDGGWDLLSYASAPVDVMATYRRLLVIDPEDREQVERLLSDYDDFRGARSTQPFPIRANGLQAALREFANPKPPRCGAHVNLAGEDFQCVEPPEHGGGHRNPDAQAVWGEGA